MLGLVARYEERRILDEALHSGRGELIAVYGRRRVGKTFLVRKHFAKQLVFELIGVCDAPAPIQLQTFSRALQEASGSRFQHAIPSDWTCAFAELITFLKTFQKRSEKRVIFFDELPWLAGRRSGFLHAFEHFWNAWASKQANVVVVVCGSAASWMLRKIVRQRGGLHNRVTRSIRVAPFTLAESHELLTAQGISLGHYQTTELFMALGGIPHYLAQVRKGESAAQNIDRLCFSRDGLLRSEFSNLYASLFEQAGRHEAVIRALATKRSGMTRAQLLAKVALGSGGAASKVLSELEESGFVLQVPRIGRQKRDAVYWLADEYSLFYIKWIERHRGASDGVWMRKQGTPAWRAWAGLAFEAVCLKHVREIKRALGIGGVSTEESSWQQRPNERVQDGAQIDLVIDRADRSMNLCEMKFSEQAFIVDKAYARELAHKRDTFRIATGTKKALFLTLVTSHGVMPNDHAREIVGQTVNLEALFVRN
jgi:uncharacterized protein